MDSKKHWLANMLMVAASVGMLYLLVLWVWIRPWQELYFASEAVKQLNMVRSGADVFVFLSSSITFLLARYRRERLGTAGLEYIALTFVTLVSVAYPFSTRAYVARMLGHQPEDLLGEAFPNVDLVFVLNQDLLITCTHLALPVRWSVLWPFELICATVTFTCLALLGSTHSQVPQICFGFSLIIAFAAEGRRMLERQDRQMFKLLLSEKEKRFAAEFKLASRDDSRSMEHPCRPDPALRSETGSTVNSLPETTATGKLFQDLGTPTARDQLFALGRAEQWLIVEDEVHIRGGQGALLGQGGFGFVIIGYFHGSEVAVKVPRSPNG